MHLRLSTAVAAPAPEVFAGFDQHLFQRLAPPFPRVTLLRYDGNLPGHQVHIRLSFLLFSQLWISHITEHVTGPDEWRFTDVGTTLPFFLSSWHHRHRILPQSDGTSVIIDDIQFEAGWRWLTPLLYPAMWLQFALRKPIYRRIFARRP